MYDALLCSLGTAQTTTNGTVVTATPATLTTASLTGTWLDLGTMPPRRGLKMRFNLSSYIAATAGPVLTPLVETSDDKTAIAETFNGVPVTGGTAAVTPNAPSFVSFEASRRYVRAKLTTTLTANGPTAIVDAYAGISRP